MKSYFARVSVFIALVLMVSLCGCGSNNTALKAEGPLETWTDTGGGVSEYRAQAVAFDIEEDLLYVGFEERIDSTGATEGRGVWKYDGDKWTDTRGAISKYHVRSLACDEKKNIVYANCYELAPGEVSGEEPRCAGVWKYNGKEWTDTGISSEMFKEAGALAYDSVHNNLYASFNKGPNTACVWKYDGKHWAEVGEDLPDYMIMSLACADKENLICAGTRGNGGVLTFNETAWTDTGGNLSGYWVDCLAYDTGNYMLYAGINENQYTGQGVWKYDGTTWTATDGAISNYPVNSLAVDISHNMIYASCFENIFGKGVWKYDGNIWVDISGKMSDYYFGNLVYDSNNNVLYAGLCTNDGHEGRGVWKYKVR